MKTVKDLIFKELGGGDRWILSLNPSAQAKDIVYMIIKTETTWKYTISSPLFKDGVNFSLKSLDIAKKWCQSHFEDFILGCIAEDT